MKYNDEDIYKTYKHGGRLDHFSFNRVYNALKNNELQAVTVIAKNNEKKIYVYIPENGKFNWIF